MASSSTIFERQYSSLVHHHLVGQYVVFGGQGVYFDETLATIGLPISVILSYIFSYYYCIILLYIDTNIKDMKR